MSPVEPGQLAQALSAYPQLGPMQQVLSQDLSINTATCLVACQAETVLAKRYGLDEYDPDRVAAQHQWVLRLLDKGFPTPAIVANHRDQTVTLAADGAWVVFQLARGEDRYHGRPVFEPFDSHEEARAAGGTLAHFHRSLADVPATWLRAFPPEAQASPFMVEREALLASVWEKLPGGIIHGDFIKRNLFWQGQAVSDVIDLDHWQRAPWLLDLALSLLPVGFNWPKLLKGEGDPHWAHLRAFLDGYDHVRPLDPTERQLLPTVMETARFAFYLDMTELWERRGQPQQADVFRGLLTGTLDWFRAHPQWARGLD